MQKEQNYTSVLFKMSQGKWHVGFQKIKKTFQKIKRKNYIKNSCNLHQGKRTRHMTHPWTMFKGGKGRGRGYFCAGFYMPWAALLVCTVYCSLLTLRKTPYAYVTRVGGPEKSNPKYNWGIFACLTYWCMCRGGGVLYTIYDIQYICDSVTLGCFFVC